MVTEEGIPFVKRVGPIPQGQAVRGSKPHGSAPTSARTPFSLAAAPEDTVMQDGPRPRVTGLSAFIWGLIRAQAGAQGLGTPEGFWLSDCYVLLDARPPSFPMPGASLQLPRPLEGQPLLRKKG